MNNYEHLLQGGIDALVDILSDVNFCHTCAYFPDDGQCLHTNRNMCVDGVREWLEAEYVEPDSWEKLLIDLDISINASSAIAKYANIVGISSTCTTDKVFSNIASRIRTLLEEEQ